MFSNGIQLFLSSGVGFSSIKCRWLFFCYTQW